MTVEEIAGMLEETGLPYAYHHFAEGESPEPPFVMYLFPQSNNFSADGTVYFKANALDVELYTDKKSPELEDRIEHILDKHGLFYQKHEDWIKSENMYEVLYEMEV